MWKRLGVPFGVDLSKNFDVSSVLDLFFEGSDVLEILTGICATAGVEIKAEPLISCSQRAARIQMSDLGVLRGYVYAFLYVYT